MFKLYYITSVYPAKGRPAPQHLTSRRLALSAFGASVACDPYEPWKVSWKSVHTFFLNLEHRHTDGQMWQLYMYRYIVFVVYDYSCQIHRYSAFINNSKHCIGYNVKQHIKCHSYRSRYVLPFKFWNVELEMPPLWSAACGELMSTRHAALFTYSESSYFKHLYLSVS